jgi:hypothetical protein
MSREDSLVRSDKDVCVHRNRSCTLLGFITKDCSVVQESFDHIPNVTCNLDVGWPQLPYYRGLRTMREGLLRVEVFILRLLRQRRRR